MMSNSNYSINLQRLKPVHTPIKLTRFITALHGMQTRGIAMRKLSACLSNAWIVTKRKKDLSRFLYHTKDHLA